MSENKRGFYWHVHHDVLMEWCYNYSERVECIRTQKLENERKIRLRLFQPVKGDLPQEVVEAGQAYVEAQQALGKARQALDKTIEKNRPAIEALHAKECPNCPWDGKTIFPNT